MRLDKYLKISLIFKTRSSAEKAIHLKQVLLNDKFAKSASAVKINDIIEIHYPLKKMKYKIILIKEKNVSKKEAKEMYEIIGEEHIEI